jgi:hypothetical protein
MADSILLRFLSSGLINVGGDDTKLGKLQATSTELAAVLTKNPAKALSFSLIAFDPQAPPTDAVILEALEVLKKQWPTYVNTFEGVPIGVLRPVLLDALLSAAREDPRVAMAFAACGRNVLPFMETGNEQSIWLDAVQEIEAAVDDRAEQEWATPASINLPPFEIGSPAPIKISSSPVKVNKEVLVAKLTAAAGGNQSGNPHWPQNNPGAWAQSLGSLFAAAIAETVDAATAGNHIGPIDLSAPIQQLTSSVSAYVGEVLRAVSGATAGLQRRTNLIWWKQALFSPSVQVSYRDLSSTIAAALMAFDLYQQIPVFSPASVSAFLEEAVRSIQSSQDSHVRSVKDFLKETSESASLEPLRMEAANLYQTPSGRCPMLALIAHVEKQAGLTDSVFRDLTGVESGTQLSNAQWASWLFRDLQAGRATKEAPKKKSGKGSA